MVLFEEILKKIGILDIWLVGNVTKDRKIFHTTTREVPGGPVTFSLPWLLLWAPKAIFHIFCSGSKDSVKHLPNTPNVHVHLQEDRQTTYFELDYRYDPRQLRLFESPQPIMPELIDKCGIQSMPDIIIFCPVFNEVNEDLVLSLRKKYPNTVLALDVQGFTRQSTVDHKIVLNSWVPSTTFLSALDIIKLSTDEITSNKMWQVLGSSQHTHVIVTAGERGSLLYSSPESQNKYGLCPPAPIKNPPDPTGAGDVFLAFVAVGYYITKNIVVSMAFSTTITTFHLSGMKLSEPLQLGQEKFQKFIVTAQNNFDKVMHWKWITKTYLGENPWEKIK